MLHRTLWVRVHSGISLSSGYTVNSATLPGDVLYIAGQPRFNHTGQVVIYKMEDGNVKVLQTLSGEQVNLKQIVPCHWHVDSLEGCEVVIT